MADEETPQQFVTRMLKAYPVMGREERRLIDHNLDQLSTRQRQIIRLRFGHDVGGQLRTLEEIGGLLGISWPSARQAESRAILMLSHPSTEWPSFTAVTWEQQAEVLLLHLERLVAERDTLESLLAAALHDARMARARVDHLEDLNSMLRRELYDTGTPDRRWTKGIAGLVLGLTVGFLGGIGQAMGEAVIDQVWDTQKASTLVINACGPEDPTTPAPAN